MLCLSDGMMIPAYHRCSGGATKPLHSPSSFWPCGRERVDWRSILLNGKRWSEDGCNHLLHPRLAWVNGRFEALFGLALSPTQAMRPATPQPSLRPTTIAVRWVKHHCPSSL